jgi:hypothetical protein
MCWLGLLDLDIGVDRKAQGEDSVKAQSERHLILYMIFIFYYQPFYGFHYLHLSRFIHCSLDFASLFKSH